MSLFFLLLFSACFKQWIDSALLDNTYFNFWHVCPFSFKLLCNGIKLLRTQMLQKAINHLSKFYVFLLDYLMQEHRLLFLLDSWWLGANQVSESWSFFNGHTICLGGFKLFFKLFYLLVGFDKVEVVSFTLSSSSFALSRGRVIVGGCWFL